MKKILAVLLLAKAVSAFGQSFTTASDIMDYIYDNIHYTLVYKTIDQAQSPEQTLALKKGNCVDTAVLFQYLMKTKLNITSVELVGIQVGSKYHMICKWFGNYYDMQENKSFYDLKKQYGSSVQIVDYN